MVLEDLHELIETLQARIDAHGPALQQSEALTRYALIDPLLRGLGWDTGDPSQVMPEYRSAAGSADYALLGMTGKPQIIVEAKKLGTQLDFKVRGQVTGYCQEEGIPYAVITDGRLWELYDVFKPVAMKDSIITTLDLGDSPATTALKALALWRASATKGTTTVGATPLVNEFEAPPISTQSAKLAAQPLGPEWQPLSEFKPQAGTKPAEVSFPDATIVVAPSWASLSTEIVRWLKSTGHITEHDLPIRLGNAQAYFVNTINANGMGAQFKTYRQVETWFVNANYNAKQQANNVRGILQRVGLNPAEFAVKLQ